MADDAKPNGILLSMSRTLGLLEGQVTSLHGEIVGVRGNIDNMHKDVLELRTEVTMVRQAQQEQGKRLGETLSRCERHEKEIASAHRRLSRHSDAMQSVKETTGEVMLIDQRLREEEKSSSWLKGAWKAITVIAGVAVVLIGWSITIWLAVKRDSRPFAAPAATQYFTRDAATASPAATQPEPTKRNW